MRRPITLMFTTAASLTAVVWLSAAVPAPFAQSSRPAPVTFSEHIAPILYENCVTCHRPGEAAPFALISYDDASRRATQIATVTKSRYMPPWHAEHGFGDFADERRLTDAQIEQIAEWVKQGKPRGDTKMMPKLPTFTDGWQLGKPDLILDVVDCCRLRIVTHIPDPVAHPMSAGIEPLCRYAVILKLARDSPHDAEYHRPVHALPFLGGAPVRPVPNAGLAT